jgi:hypothetical protein
MIYFAAAELLIRDFNVYTAKLSNTDLMPNNTYIVTAILYLNISSSY